MGPSFIENPPLINGVHFEQTPGRLKIVLPARREWPYLIIYTVMVLIWLVMMVGGLIYLVEILFSGAAYRFVFAVILLILLLVLFRFGRFLSREWARYVSNREVLFINKEEFIVRRPVSIWGNTDVYDMEHVTPIYARENQSALAFDYGYRHVIFGGGLSQDARNVLARYLNDVYFAGRSRSA